MTFLLHEITRSVVLCAVSIVVEAHVNTDIEKEHL